MAKKGDYTISDIYQGGYSSLKPNYTGPSYGGKHVSAGSLALSTDPRTANILKETSDKLSTGVKQIDITAVSPEVFDSMPKQHLKEVDRLSKLTGVDISMHGPVMDVAGFTKQGRFEDMERENAERKVMDALLRAKELKPDGNIPVNFHTSEGIPGSQFLPPEEREKLKKEGKDTKYKKLLVVNRDSGQIAPLKKEERYYPGTDLKKAEIRAPEEERSVLNESEWHNKIDQIVFNKERADEIIKKSEPLLRRFYEDEDLKKKVESGDYKYLSPPQKEAFRRLQVINSYLQDIHKQANNFFSAAYKYGTSEQRNQLEKVNQEFKSKIEKDKTPWALAEAMADLVQDLKKKSMTPEMWVPLEEYTKGRTAETFGNAAFQTYKKLKGKNVPILNIENPPATHALSTGEDVRNIVEESRKKFVDNAIKEGMSKSKAKKEAEKLIGATWDVGHINMLRKYGYKEEDIVKESEKVKDVLKMVHLSDNFGFEHTELPMGMGNVPMKEIMENLGKKGFEAKKIIEAGHWWQHFQSPPFQQVLEASGSPIYGMKMAPYWNQTNQLQEGYFGGYGQMLPQTNYETFGAGFSQLPQELGGQRPGAQGSRMSGRQME